MGWTKNEAVVVITVNVLVVVKSCDDSESRLGGVWTVTGQDQRCFVWAIRPLGSHSPSARTQTHSRRKCNRCQWDENNFSWRVRILARTHPSIHPQTHSAEHKKVPPSQRVQLGVIISNTVINSWYDVIQKRREQTNNLQLSPLPSINCTQCTKKHWPWKKRKSKW